MMTTAEPITTDAQLRWARAASWARGQSFGPYGHGVDTLECKRIERLRDLILRVGEERAWTATTATARTGAA